MFSPARLVRLLLLACLLQPLRADVVINEVFTAGSDRLLQWDAAGNPRLGVGTPWQQSAFVDTAWQSGAGPFGYGIFTNTPAPVFGTNTASVMQYLTPTLYLRKAFTVSGADAARTDPLQLTISYNDGFICYVDGVEVARRWAGPAKQFQYHDQPAFSTNLNTTTNPTTYSTETIALGAANTLLTAGSHVIAIQGLNVTYTSTNFLVKADLQIVGTTTSTLVANTDTWKYFPGVVEPSGGLYDPTLLYSGKLNAPWGIADFDDSTWTAGIGPMRVGSTGAGTVLTGVVGNASTVYARARFNVTAAQAADPQGLQLLVDYDDAFVAYINGVEVTRANVGTFNVFTPRTAVATTTRNNGTQTPFTLGAASTLLKVGANELAIQVHNVAVTDTDLYLKADLKTAGGTALVVNTGAWRYLVGTVEPVAEVDSEDEDSPDGQDSSSQWVELFNNGASDANLLGWALTDDSGKKAKWQFPAVTIPAGGYLVVMCDGQNLVSNPGGFLHTSFKLNAGEFVGLYDANGTAIDRILPVLPAMDPFHSYGRDGSGNLVYFDAPTPGAANAGTTETGFVAMPVISLASGFYTGTQTVTLSTTTPGATIRYTLDGSEPTATSTASGSSLSVAASTSVRARAFATGLIPSPVATATYMLGEAAARKTIPAICITGDLTRTLYRPFGVTAINPNSTTASTGNYVGGGWAATPTATPDPTQYNNPSLHGKFIERPAALELVYPAGTAPAGYLGFKMDFGLRLSGSPYTRPRYVLTLQNALSNPNTGVWSNTATEKSSFNFYFRDELSGDTLTQPVFPNSSITSYHDLRFRAGHNDTNPFIHDETVRRLYLDMGQVGSAGILTTLYVNGVYKGFYNLCQHLKEDFFQKSYNSSNSFDVRQVTDVSAGDDIAFEEMMAYARTNSQATLANYQSMQTRLDMVNFCDYLLVATYCGVQDWPHNNYVCSREHTDTGLTRFHVWDAEGSFGTFGATLRSNSFQTQYAAIALGSPLLTTTSDQSPTDLIKILYTALKNSPEFRLQFADRIQKHLVNSDGALSDANVQARYAALRAQIVNFLTPSDKVPLWVTGTGTDKTHYTLSGGATGSITNAPARRTIMLTGYTDDQLTYPTPVFVNGHYKTEGLWPDTAAPVFSPVTQGSTIQVTMTNPNAGGTIYYSVNGNDPRVAGGAVQGSTYTAPITIAQTTLVRARVLNTNGEWSPLMEATYTISGLPPVLITELMYHPPDVGSTSGDEYQFIELKNTGASAVAMNGWTLQDGATFTFPPGSTLAPGGFAVVVKNPVAFAAKYPAVAIAGTFTGTLAHGGELVTLHDVSGALVMGVTYSDTSPWPTLPDGYGNSLVPVLANSNAAPNVATSWRASGTAGGSPGADDPAPTNPAIVVNEILPNGANGAPDAVELFNPTAQAADISGWYLSDNASSPKKFQIPAGTIIPANGYLVFTETDFNPAIPVGTNVSFGFDQNGEEVSLQSADGNYTHSFAFNAAVSGVSFGRYVSSGGVEYRPAPPQKALTLGAANAGPLVGPVVITRMLPIPANTTNDPEYVELRNISNTTVPLYDPTNTALGGWKVDGFGYTFATGVSLAPGQIVIVSAVAPASFRTRYNISPNIAIYGGTTGSLKDTGEQITLQKPVAIVGAKIYYADVDAVNYLGVSPWPTLAAGVGIERSNPYGYGSDPANWRASSTSNGTPGVLSRDTLATWQSQHFTAAQLANSAISGATADPDGDGLTNQMEWALGLDPLTPNKGQSGATGLAMDGAAGPFLTMQFRRSLGIPAGTQFLYDTSADLSTWSLGTGVVVGTPVNNGDGTETVTVRDTTAVPAGTAAKRYLRVRIIGN